MSGNILIGKFDPGAEAEAEAEDGRGSFPLEDLRAVLNGIGDPYYKERVLEETMGMAISRRVSGYLIPTLMIALGSRHLPTRFFSLSETGRSKVLTGIGLLDVKARSALCGTS